MPNYVVNYKLTLWGSIDVEAASEEEAGEKLYDFPNASLLECADLGDAGDVEVTDIERETCPLEQLAEQAE